MKVTFFAFAFLIASVAAVPQYNQEYEDEITRESRTLLQQVVTRITRLISNRILESGLDPLVLEGGDIGLELPGLVISKGVSDVTLEGLSNIVVNDVSIGVITGNLNIDVSVPQIKLTIGKAANIVEILGRELGFTGSGSIELNQLRLNIRATVSRFPSVSINDVTVAITNAGVRSNLVVSVFGQDVSDEVNSLLSRALTAIVERLSEQLSDLWARLIDIIVRDL